MCCQIVMLLLNCSCSDALSSPTSKPLLLHIAVASEAICKWGGTMPAQSGGRNFFDVPPHFSVVPPHEGAQRLFVTDWETIEVVKSGEGQ